MKRSVISALLFVMVIFLSGFTTVNYRGEEESEIIGVWVRTSDKLMIQVSNENDTQLHSFIVKEGNEKFPCEVTHLPIYKDIVKISKKLWRCNFLVVTMGSCATNYEEGIIQILKNGDMEITCVGFEKKVYTKLKPRYDD
jgi:hypothetical protein